MDEETRTIEDDVPVYEPVYPDHERMCDHSTCNQDSLPSQRLCEDCVSVIGDNAPDNCPYCKYHTLHETKRKALDN